MVFTRKIAEFEHRTRKGESQGRTIVTHGINYFINHQLIYNYPESLCTKQGTFARQLDTGGEIVSTFDHLSYLSPIDVNWSRKSSLAKTRYVPFDDTPSLNAMYCFLLAHTILCQCCSIVAMFWHEWCQDRASKPI